MWGLASFTMERHRESFTVVQGIHCNRIERGEARIRLELHCARVGARAAWTTCDHDVCGLVRLHRHLHTRSCEGHHQWQDLCSGSAISEVPYPHGASTLSSDRDRPELKRAGKDRGRQERRAKYLILHWHLLVTILLALSPVDVDLGLVDTNPQELVADLHPQGHGAVGRHRHPSQCARWISPATKRLLETYPVPGLCLRYHCTDVQEPSRNKAIQPGRPLGRLHHDRLQVFQIAHEASAHPTPDESRGSRNQGGGHGRAAEGHVASRPQVCAEDVGAWSCDLHRVDAIIAVVGQLVCGCCRCHAQGRLVVAGVRRD